MNNNPPPKPQFSQQDLLNITEQYTNEQHNAFSPMGNTSSAGSLQISRDNTPKGKYSSHSHRSGSQKLSKQNSNHSNRYNDLTDEQLCYDEFNNQELDNEVRQQIKDSNIGNRVFSTESLRENSKNFEYKESRPSQQPTERPPTQIMNSPSKSQNQYMESDLNNQLLSIRKRDYELYQQDHEESKNEEDDNEYNISEQEEQIQNEFIQKFSTNSVSNRHNKMAGIGSQESFDNMATFKRNEVVEPYSFVQSNENSNKNQATLPRHQYSLKVQENEIQQEELSVQNNHQYRQGNGNITPYSFGSQNQQQIEQYLQQKDMNQPSYYNYPLQQSPQKQTQQNLEFQNQAQLQPSLYQQMQPPQEQLALFSTFNGPQICPHQQEVQESDKIQQMPKEPSQQILNQEQLNALIDIEKNNIILQYETILSQLNIEFQKLLIKTKESEEANLQKDFIMQTQQRIMIEKDEQLANCEKTNKHLVAQVQSLLHELDNTSTKRESFYASQQQQQNNEQWVYEKEFLEQKISNLEFKLNMMLQNEADYKDQLETALNKIRQLEQQIRLKEEELNHIQRENSALQKDILNIKSLERHLKSEIEGIKGQKQVLEDSVLDLKSQISSQQLIIKQRESELDSMLRDNRNLFGELNMLQSAYQEVQSENNHLKESTAECDNLKMHMKNLIDKQESQICSLQTEIANLQRLVEKEQMNTRNVEDHYKNQLERQMINYKSQKNLEQMTFPAANGYQMANENEVAMRGSQSVIKQQQSPDLQQNIEQNNYKNGGAQRYNQSPIRSRDQLIQEKQSPKLNENQYKNTIAWPYLYSRNTDQQQVTQQPPAQAQLSQRSITSINSANKSINQGYHSNEKEKTAPSIQQIDDKYKRLSIDQANKNIQQPSSQKSSQHFQMMSHQDIHRQEGAKQQSEMKTGKKLFAQKSPSRVDDKQVHYLQNTLSTLQIDKEKVENEYRRLGTSKNKAQIDKKQQLELEIDIIDRNIQNVKQKLREFGAI